MSTLELRNLLSKLLIELTLHSLDLFTNLLLMLFLNLLHLRIVSLFQVFLRLLVFLCQFSPERVHLPLVLRVSGRLNLTDLFQVLCFQLLSQRFLKLVHFLLVSLL